MISPEKILMKTLLKKAFKSGVETIVIISNAVSGGAYMQFIFEDGRKETSKSEGNKALFDNVKQLLINSIPNNNLEEITLKTVKLEINRNLEIRFMGVYTIGDKTETIDQTINF